MDELIRWLREQLDRDQKAAEEMKKVFPTPWELADRGWMVRIVADKPHFREVVRLEQQFAPDGYGWLSDAVEHVFLQDPDRVLREVEAKRLLLADVAAAIEDDAQIRRIYRDLGQVDLAEKPMPDRSRPLRLLALPFSDHPGYQESWRP